MIFGSKSVIVYLCHKHINQKSENEQRPTGSWFVLSLKTAKKSLKRDSKRAERDFLLSKPYIMLPKTNRLDRKTVEKIFKEGRFINSATISLKFFVDKTQKSAHIGFITPKTASKKAPIRNLLRRRGYAVIKKQMNAFPAGFVGAFVFGKKSTEQFAGLKTKTKNPVVNLEHEINSILSKIR